MGGACRRSIHLRDGVEASQRVRSSGRNAPSSTLAFNEQSGNCSGPEVGLEDIANDVQTRFWIVSGLLTIRERSHGDSNRNAECGQSTSCAKSASASLIHNPQVLKMNLDNPDTAVRLRFGVLDVVDAGWERARAYPDDPLGHIIGVEAAISPDHAYDRDLDLWQNVGRRRHDGTHAEDRNQQLRRTHCTPLYRIATYIPQFLHARPTSVCARHP
jgi:hypothetical protein